MKNLDAAYLAKLEAQEHKPRVLYELYLDAGTLYLADTLVDITFPTAGQVYTALGAQYEDVELSSGDMVDTVQISMDNVNSVLGLWAKYESFRGKVVIIKRVFADLLGSSDYAEITFSGIMQEPVVDQYAVVVEAVSGQILRRAAPQDHYSQQCRWTLGGAKCGKDVASYAVTESNAPDSGSTTTLVDSDLDDTIENLYTEGTLICGFESGDYAWSEKRRISAYDNVTKTITVAIPFSLATTSAVSWQVTAGCDKTWDTCYNRYNNLINFGGFIHVR